MAIQRRTPPDAKIERKIITGMIISDDFMRGIRSMWTHDCLLAKDTKMIAQWCIEYFDQYEKAPGKHIEDIFRDKKEIDIAPEVADNIEELLSDLSDEYTRGSTFNASYALDNAEKHFRIAHLQNVKYELSKAITAGRTEEAEALLKGFERVSRITAKGIDPLRDKEAIRDAFNEDSSDILFQLPGELGKIIGPFERNYLFAVIGEQGIGKTWWLWWIAERAALAGLNVVFVSLEMTERQMVKRIQSGITGLPDKRYAGKILIPVFDCALNQNGDCRQRASKVSLYVKDKKGGKDDPDIKLDYEDSPKNYIPCTKCRGTKAWQKTVWYREVTREEITATKVLKKAKKMEGFLKRSGKIKLIEYPPRTLTISELRASLYNLEHYEDFICDVLVTDFADEFADENHRSNPRYAIQDIWAGHKALAGQRKMLVVTGSQSNTARTGKDIKKGDWAEDISKLGKIDGGMAINQNDADKIRGLSRIDKLKDRHGENKVEKITVLQQLNIGKIYLDSCRGEF